MTAYLDSGRSLCDVLRQRAHEAVSIVANGFLLHESNGFVTRERSPSQHELDIVRELSLVFLYRLLFALKAEAMNVLPMRDLHGAKTPYQKFASTEAIFQAVSKLDPQKRIRSEAAFDMLRDLFTLIDQGGQYDVIAYTGGLFSAHEYQELNRLRLHDDVIHTFMGALIYLNTSVAVPYADLDVRDLGDVYEGLLELRLVREPNVPLETRGARPFVLRNQLGEKKASGSYFTPDAIVDYLVRQCLQPLLETCGKDARGILSLKVIDPAMGSGHFLLKAIDVIASFLTLHSDQNQLGLAYWKRQVVEQCVYGIDVNPMAVELAKVTLGLHTATPGRPLAFLDHHLTCGNTLVEARRDGVGFDAVVGNPPWNKLKPSKRDFYGHFSDDVANTQGPSLDKLIDRLHHERPELAAEWESYTKQIETLVDYLTTGGDYTHQSVVLDGKKTGGDPDLFRFFMERAHQLLREGGRLAQVVPSTLWQSEGCTGLRRLLFDKYTVECVYTFENYRKWAFAIDSRFKFTMFIGSRKVPGEGHTFPAAFMLRDARVLEGGMTDRILRMSRIFIDAVSPGTLAFIDVKNEFERALVERLYKAHPALRESGDENSGWRVKYRNELHMTNAAWMFRTREWMKARGFTQVVPIRDAEGRWTQRMDGPGAVAELPDTLPAGGEYWISASEGYYRNREFAERRGEVNGTPLRWFVHPSDVGKNEEKARIFPGETYTALYDGRLIHLFDHCYQRYVSGEGPKQIWTRLEITEKIYVSRVFTCRVESNAPLAPRCGFRDIARGTDERTMICAIVPAGVACGNKVPVLHVAFADDAYVLPALLGSFIADFLLRLRVGATLNWIYVSRLAVPARSRMDDSVRGRLAELTVRLSCTTPEMADVWAFVFPNVPWSYDVAERNGWKRAELRAEIDAIVADLYGLTIPEYAYVLTTFPLLDRDQPPLPGDVFVTEGGESSLGTAEERGVTWDETSDGIVEMVPRSFVTRDLALLRYMQRKQYPIPADLESFYRDEVRFDSRGPSSRFRIGAVRDLETRVLEANKRGAMAYVPSGRRGGQEELEAD